MAIEQPQTNGSTEPAISDSPPPSGLPEGLTTDVRTLIDMMGQGGITDLHLETTTVKLRLRARGAAGLNAGEAQPAAVASSAEPDATEAEGPLVTAPMIGTFYRTPAPGEPVFVEVGDPVEPGQTIGIIEAMKIMNEIVAEAGGIAAEFLVENGQPVEYGQPLLRLASPPPA